MESNFQRIQQRLIDVVRGQGRDPADVRLVAVTKYVDFDLTWQLAQLGCHHLGESRPQQLASKVEAARSWEVSNPGAVSQPGSPAVQWHLIGHLQRNKARRAWQDADWIHSVDSLRLLKTLASYADESESSTKSQPKLLLEVNVSGDTAKHGFQPSEMPAVLEAIATLPVDICGLMAMASREGGPDRARRDFAALRELRAQLQAQSPDNAQLEELSMGMSGDWEQAVAEGATMVRIGSALFEGVME